MEKEKWTTEMGTGVRQGFRAYSLLDPQSHSFRQHCFGKLLAYKSADIRVVVVQRREGR